MPDLKKLIYLLLSLFFPFQGFAQKPDSLVNHSGQYRLDLPENWMKPKLIRAVTDILPGTIVELKDRDFCTSGRASYMVRLLLDSLVVMNQQTSLPVEIGGIPHYTISFDYRFFAALNVSDSLGRPVSRLLLVSGDELMTWSKQFSTLPQNVVYKYVTIYNRQGRPVGRRLVEDAPAVNNYVPGINAYSVLTEDFLLSICEQKIYEIKRWLKKFHSD